MERQNFRPWHFFILSLVCGLLLVRGIEAVDTDRKVYIVYMGDKPKGSLSAPASHISILQQVLGSVASTSLVYSYNRSFNGFAAKLTEKDVKILSGLNGIVSVFPSEKKHLHTTRSWNFMGFTQQVKRTTVESDTIVGVLDSGIWPESESFSDVGFSPPPAKWKGICQPSLNFTCNNKIIGARYYRSSGLFKPDDIQSPRDSEGHGTHTASTAAGGLVSMASLYGLASGTARGGVPSARIAVYKICWTDGCDDADILAAFDNAIADGVDIISLSVGGSKHRLYFNDSIAIGSFHAMRNGILTSNSAGNDGPTTGSTTNVSPWTLTVAASTIDRKFFTDVLIGNNVTYQGVSINTFELNKFYPLIYGGDAPNALQGYNSSSSRYCLNNSLDPTLVSGKIVLCDRKAKAGPFYAHAVGAIMQDSGAKDVAFSFPLPASYIDPDSGTAIFNYMSSGSNAVGTILKSYETNDTAAPYVASFSSRGPNVVTPDILKPDVTAPGVDILAAWSQISPVSSVPGDSRLVPFNIISGTSMACPHATGAAAYVKTFNPTWSPAAIKSALMTTAFPMSAETMNDAEFGFGSGHINPVKAIDPGLVYDAREADYVAFLCGQGYTDPDLQIITGDASTCSSVTAGADTNLNYPSFALRTLPLASVDSSFIRTVTNVGSSVSTYKATIYAPSSELKIQVNPSVLSFASQGQQLSFTLAIQGTMDASAIRAALVWDDGTHQVRSPIVVYI